MPMAAERAGTKEPICASTAISAFWRRKVDLPAMLGPVTSQMRASVISSKPRRSGRVGAASTQSFSMKAPALAARQRLLHHGMAAAADLEGRGSHRRWAACSPARARQLGKARLAVELGERRGDLAERLLLRGDGGRELGEHLLLEAERAVGRGDDAALGLDQLRRGEAHRVGHGLAVPEALRQGLAQQRLGVRLPAPRCRSPGCCCGELSAT